MSLSKNLIVALLGLGCYAHCNNINLANNTTVLLLILALLAKTQTDTNGSTTVYTNPNGGTITMRSGTNGNSTYSNGSTQPFTNSGWNCPWAQNNTIYQTPMSFGAVAFSPNGSCACNNGMF